MIDIVNWPIVAIVLGGIAIFAFRPALSRLLDRLQSASKEGVQFERPQDNTSSVLSLPFVEVMKYPVSASVLSREQTIQEQLKAFDLKSEAEKISVLTRAFANAQVVLEFNNLAHIIFGSQVRFLIHLSGTPSGVPAQETEVFFKQAQEAFPFLHDTNNAENWLHYLIVTNLVARQEDRVDLTQFGADFLKHLVDARIAYERYG